MYSTVAAFLFCTGLNTNMLNVGENMGKLCQFSQGIFPTESGEPGKHKGLSCAKSTGHLGKG